MSNKNQVLLSPEMQQKLGHYIPASWEDGLRALAEAPMGGFTFAVQTDTHFSVNSNDQQANCLKALSHFVPLDFYANFGDYIKGYFMKEIGKIENTPDKTMYSLKELTRRYLEDANCPVLVTFGNHDTNQLWCKHYGTADQQLTQADHREQVIDKIKAHNGDRMVTDGQSNYYYVDFPKDDVRMIMLNTTDGQYEAEFGNTAMLSDRQIEWLRDEALNTTAQVFVVCHVPLIKEFPGNDGSDVKNSALARKAVEEFIQKGGRFIVYLCGHTHIQASLTDENGRLHISFKNGGGIAEVVTLDTDNKKITTRGLGAVENREFSYR